MMLETRGLRKLWRSRGVVKRARLLPKAVKKGRKSMMRAPRVPLRNSSCPVRWEKIGQWLEVAHEVHTT